MFILDYDHGDDSNQSGSSGTTSGATSVEDSGGSSGENSAFMSLYNFITNHLSSSQHIWCINKTRIAYNLEIEDLKPFLLFWIKHCDETKDNHTDGCTCVAKMKNRVVTYSRSLAYAVFSGAVFTCAQFKKNPKKFGIC